MQAIRHCCSLPDDRYEEIERSASAVRRVLCEALGAPASSRVKNGVPQSPAGVDSASETPTSVLVKAEGRCYATLQLMNDVVTEGTKVIRSLRMLLALGSHFLIRMSRG